MYRLTGEDDFGAAAARWLRYDRPARQARAIAQKAAFVASGIDEGSRPANLKDRIPRERNPRRQL
jgi:hypothetical protein